MATQMHIERVLIDVRRSTTNLDLWVAQCIIVPVFRDSHRNTRSVSCICTSAWYVLYLCIIAIHVLVSSSVFSPLLTRSAQLAISVFNKFGSRSLGCHYQDHQWTSVRPRPLLAQKWHRLDPLISKPPERYPFVCQDFLRTQGPVDCRRIKTEYND